MSEELDENDPNYAFKRWGRDYRFNDDYWRWVHARRDKEEEGRLDRLDRNASAENDVRSAKPKPTTQSRGW